MKSYPAVLAETEAQALILTELQNAHGRLHRNLQSIASEAALSAGYRNLDTLFLTGKVADLSKNVATYQTLRDAARWAGCTAETIGTVCQPTHVRIDFAAAVAE